MEEKKRTKISFATVEYSDLKKIIDLNQQISENIFDEWFNFQYFLSEEEEKFLKDLILENIFYVSSYTEEELKVEFITPLLRKVNFRTKNKRGWYERLLVATINGEIVGGVIDFMVAKGEETPESPYFFIQEFKREGKASHPKNQLLAEMLVAIELNNVNLMRGAYVIGRIWHFVILEKITDNSYQYFVSDAFDSLSFKGLKQIFICLQAVKLKYCE